jgi:hypothetical protein
MGIIYWRILDNGGLLNVDIRDQQTLYNIGQQNYSWNITSPTNLAPQYGITYILWYRNYQSDRRDRVNGNFSLKL